MVLAALGAGAASLGLTASHRQSPGEVPLGLAVLVLLLLVLLALHTCAVLCPTLARGAANSKSTSTRGSAGGEGAPTSRPPVEHIRHPLAALMAVSSANSSKSLDGHSIEMETVIHFYDRACDGEKRTQQASSLIIFRSRQ